MIENSSIFTALQKTLQLLWKKRKKKGLINHSKLILKDLKSTVVAQAQGKLQAKGKRVRQKS